MATYDAIIRGLQILKTYEPSPNPHIGGAEHDAIYTLDMPPSDMEPNDVAELEALGWDYDLEFSAWRHFA